MPESAICLAVRVTEGSASTVASRPPGSHQGCHQRDSWARRLPSVIVRVNGRLRGGRPRPTITRECCRFILMERCGAGNSADQMPDTRLTVRAGPLGQLACRRPGPQDGPERPRPVKTMYGTAKNTWAFPPTTAGNFTRTPGGSARSRHLSLGVACPRLAEPRPPTTVPIPPTSGPGHT